VEAKPSRAALPSSTMVLVETAAIHTTSPTVARATMDLKM
jgi:hypothetical protein